MQSAEDSAARARARLFRLLLSFWSLLELGRASEWLAAFDEFRSLPEVHRTVLTIIPVVALCQARLGQLHVARRSWASSLCMTRSGRARTIPTR